jgi:hypothetical protein
VTFFTAGHRVTGDDMQGVVPLAAYRVSTQSIGSTTVQNDDTLFWSIIANAVYDVDCVLYYTGGPQGSSDIQVTFSVPGSTVWRWNAVYTDTSGNAQNSTQNLAGDTQVAGTNGVGGTPRTMRIQGTLAPGNNSGTFRLQWAQNTSNATATVMQPYSRLVGLRIF